MNLSLDHKLRWAPQARMSADKDWPIRRADGRTFAQVQPEYQKKEL